MPLVPRKPRDDSPGEQERYVRDTAAFKADPGLYGGYSGLPPVKADSKPPPAGPLRPSGGDPLPEELPPVETERGVEHTYVDPPVDYDSKISKEIDASWAEPKEQTFQQLTDDVLGEMTKARLEAHALSLPNGEGFDPDRRLGNKKIIEQIKVRYENLNNHEQGQ